LVFPLFGIFVANGTQYNLRFLAGAPMLSFAWHAERKPSSGLLDIFRHALLNRSCSRNLSSSYAAAPAAGTRRAVAAAPPLQPRGCDRSQPACSSAPCTRGHLSRWDQSCISRSSKRCYCSTTLAAESAPAAPRGEGEWQTGPFSPQKTDRGGKKKKRKKAVTVLPLHPGRSGVAAGTGTVSAEGSLPSAARPSRTGANAQAFGAPSPSSSLWGRGRQTSASSSAVVEHPLLRRLCQPRLKAFAGPTGGISIHLDYTLPDADAFGKAANKAERFLLAPQAAKLRQALSSGSCCQALLGLGSAQ